MILFDLFLETDIRDVIIVNEMGREIYNGKFGDLSMRFAYFKVYKIVKEDGIMIVYI